MQQQPIGHNDIAAICREILVSLLSLSDIHKIPGDPWDQVVFDFAATYSDEQSREEPYSADEVRADFALLAMSIIKSKPATPPRYSQAMQRHYEFYTNPENMMLVGSADRGQVELALERLKEGLVKPAPWHK